MNEKLLLNKTEWLQHPMIYWSKEEIEKADKDGFIGTKNDIDCYVTTFIK